MPGIVGLITRMPRERAQRELSQMLKTLCHESFYESGTWCNDSLGVHVGWTALKGSFASGMPVRNERGDLTLVFSGEEYPDPEIGTQLKAAGHRVDAAPSEYLVRLCGDEPAGFVTRLNGMFHGLLVDHVNRTATLFNDRYGMHRLYYHESRDTFYFASEAKAILAVCPELRTPDPRGLGEFVACSCVLENRTIFKDIQVLPAASSWTFRNGELASKASYFDPRLWEDQTRLDDGSFYQELRTVLSQNLPRYFAGPEVMGIAMTGGLDTRVILACHPPAAGSLPSYTFGSTFRDSQDVRIGRKIAEICQQPHQVIEVGDQFLTRFPHYAERSIYLTEGTVDVYRASDLFVSEKVRQIAPAKIVGTYGSEIVCHAVMFKPVQPLDGLFRPEFLSYVDQAGTTYHALRQQHPVTFAAFRQSPWYHSGILALEKSQLTVRSPFMDNDFVRTVYRAPRESASGDDVRLRLIREGSPVLAKIRSDRGVGANGNRLASTLSRGWLEFTFKAEYAYDYGMPQWVARVDHALSAFRLERLFLGRHKLLHFRVWYRDTLADYVRQMLLDPRTLSRPYLNRRAVEAVVEGHVSGIRNHTTEIHKLLTLELLHRLFLDSP